MARVTTCGELVDYLATQPRDRLVVLSSDAEGNSFDTLCDAFESMYDDDLREVFLTPEEQAREEEEYAEAPDSAVRVVLLSP